MDQWFLDQARNGNVYHSHNTTAGIVTDISATCTGLVLENPFGSGKELVVAKMSFTGSTLGNIREVGIVVSTAISESLSTSTTAAVIHNGRVSGSNANNGAGRSYSIATLATEPLWFRPLMSARMTGAFEGAQAEVEFDGTVFVMPGTYIAFSSETADTVGLCSIIWAEIDE
ncbi:hypothetical protein LCGC14_2269900 [marine sediment metagenome]|uniref:Uncharacterized protein n=1 Tax=marine sediment metagenome TaxID=412755 RepID=A0A0F9CX87_9ZZZZ